MFREEKKHGGFFNINIAIINKNILFINKYLLILHYKYFIMKTKTEEILMVLKVLALLAAIGFSIICGSEILSLVASFINADWAKRVYGVEEDLFNLRKYYNWYYISAMSLIIASSAYKAFIWYLVFDLLLKLKLTTPFSVEVAQKLDRIAYSLLAVWCLGIISKGYFGWLSKATDLNLTVTSIESEFIFIAGIVYIISQIFKRGIEIQEENLLTV